MTDTESEPKSDCRSFWLDRPIILQIVVAICLTIGVFLTDDTAFIIYGVSLCCWFGVCGLSLLLRNNWVEFYVMLGIIAILPLYLAYLVFVLVVGDDHQDEPLSKQCRIFWCRPVTYLGIIDLGLIATGVYLLVMYDTLPFLAIGVTILVLSLLLAAITCIWIIKSPLSRLQDAQP